ncbi:hypothetical protein LQZ21_06745 [Treponema sp. TIM-1]|uniref:hypothetical protein n=1 Tax=Treponema sp. TIM-1 TaxID=2898417 RepID=UPI00397F6202
MKRIFEYLLGAVIFLAMIALFSLAAMFLWNKLLPGIFGLPVINYWQTAGLLILARIIFGGYRGIGKNRTHGLSGHKNPIRDRWDSMSEEARKAFIKKHGDFFLHDHFHHRFTDDTGKETDTENE